MKHLLFCLLLVLNVFGQKQAYIIYNADGKEVSYEKMLKSLSKREVVLFGEEHNNPISHWLQLALTQELYALRPLILGAEMFETDNQTALNNFLAGKITQKGLDSSARLWPNYKTDYAPLVNFAKKNQLTFIATNIPRRYANKVYKNGFGVLDTLSALERSWIAPLPIRFNSELPTYKSILKMAGDHGTPELVKAQATKDATMAHFIAKNLKKDHIFLHFHGTFHSDFYEGILWYLKLSKPDIKYGTIATVSQENIHKLEKEHLKKADFIICVDAQMTKTY